MLSKKGFTLIELVIVIALLGILAVTALPRFIDVKADATSATLSGLESALRSANSMVFAKATIQGQEESASGTVTLGNGDTISTQYGYIAYDDSARATGAIQMLTAMNFRICHHLAEPADCPNGEWLFDIDDDAIQFYHISIGFSPALNNGGVEPLCYLLYTLPDTAGASPSYLIEDSEC